MKRGRLAPLRRRPPRLIHLRLTWRSDPSAQESHWRRVGYDGRAIGRAALCAARETDNRPASCTNHGVNDPHAVPWGWPQAPCRGRSRHAWPCRVSQCVGVCSGRRVAPPMWTTCTRRTGRRPSRLRVSRRARRRPCASLRSAPAVAGPAGMDSACARHGWALTRWSAWRMSSSVTDRD